LPAGHSFAQPNVGSDDSDSDVNSNGYTALFSFDGSTSLDFDAGIYLG